MADAAVCVCVCFMGHTGISTDGRCGGVCVCSWVALGSALMADAAVCVCSWVALG